MAHMIKQATEVLALKVTLQVRDVQTQSDPTPRRDSTAQVELSLERFRQGENILENIWRVDAAALGLTGRVEPGRDLPLSLPDTVLHALIEAVNQAASDSGWREPLWLHFVKPYGMIGALDWEGFLAPVLQRPLFRLPDYLESIRVHPQTMEAVVVCDLPTDEPRFDLAQELPVLVEAMAAGLLGRPTTFNLFVSDPWRDRVAAALQGRSDVVLHTPPSARLCWLEWVGEAMAGRRIDWMQFLMHADASNMSPSLAFTFGPGEIESRHTAAYVSPAEVAQCLNRQSAWGCGFASPPGGSAGALRFFADAVAQARPGPILFEGAAEDGWSSRLSDRLNCLFFPDPQDLQVQANPGGFLYVQPERIGVRLGSAEAALLAATVPTAVAAALAVPSWAAAANTFITSARQQWGLAAALGSVSASATLDDPSAWTANAVGGLERIASGQTLSTAAKAAEDTLQALSALTQSLTRGEGA